MDCSTVWQFADLEGTNEAAALVDESRDLLSALSTHASYPIVLILFLPRFDSFSLDYSLVVQHLSPHSSLSAASITCYGY